MAVRSIHKKSYRTKNDCSRSSRVEPKDDKRSKERELHSSYSRRIHSELGTTSIIREVE